MLIVTILPIVLPLAAALANIVLPIRLCRTSWYRLTRVAYLICVAILLVQVPSLTTGVFTLPLGVTGLIALPPLTFMYTNIGITIGLVYICSCLLTNLDDSAYGQSSPKRTLELVMVSSVLATCLAANITTLCFCWTAVAVISIIGRTSQAAREQDLHVYWSLLCELSSVVLVMIVTVLALIQQRIGTFSDITTLPYMVTILMLAALLRLGIFPLPGNYKSGWADRIATLCTGVWLLLRIASVSTQSLPGWQWLVPTIATSSVITALLANLMVSRAMRRNYLIASLMGVIILAPLLVPVAGTGLAVLGFINMVLVSSLLDQRGDGMTPIQAQIVKWLKVAASLTLMGLPLTLGFLCRWELDRMTGGTDQRMITILLTLSYTLVTLSLWRQAAWELRRATANPTLANNLTRQRIVVNWAICGVGALFILGILFVGIYPGIINILLPTPLLLPNLVFSLAKEDITTWIYLIVTTFVIPLAGAFFLYYQRSLFKLSSQTFEAIRLFAGFKWFYYGLGIILAWIYRLGELILNTIELKYLLGWVSIWMIIIIVFLVGT